MSEDPFPRYRKHMPRSQFKEKGNFDFCSDLYKQALS